MVSGLFLPFFFFTLEDEESEVLFSSLWIDKESLLPSLWRAL